MRLHVATVRPKRGFRAGAEPLYFLHQPGTAVYGTVLIFPGSTQRARDSIIQARFLFSRKFNVIALNVAGHGLQPKYWPFTVLRRSAGYKRIRNILLNNRELARLVATIIGRRALEVPKELVSANARYGTLMTKVLQVLRISLSTREYSLAKETLSLLRPGIRGSGLQKALRKYYVSAHQLYESDPFLKLSLIDALPGPVFTVSFSLGTTAAIHLAAKSRAVSKAVLLAPYFGPTRSGAAAEIRHFTNVLGVLDLVSVQAPPISGLNTKIPGKYIPALSLAGDLLNVDNLSNTVRENTKSLCVIALDDTLVNVPQTLEYCRSKIASKVFEYPKELGIGHSVTPEVGSKYGISLLEEIANYFINDRINRTNMLVRK